MSGRNPRFALLLAAALAAVAVCHCTSPPPAGEQAPGGAKPSDQFESVEVGQSDVENHGVIVLFGRREQSLRSAFAPVAGVPLALQTRRDLPREFVIVLDQKNPHDDPGAA